MFDWVKSKVKEIGSALWAQVRPAATVAVISAVAVFGSVLTGWLGDLHTAVDAWGDGGEFVLPDTSILSRAFFSASAGLVTGVGAAIIGALKSLFGSS